MTDNKATLAVALQYDKPQAPRVTAMGRGELARRIVEIAEANKVPIQQNAGLAIALSQVKLDDEIPENLYRAVAEVLGFILRMSGKIKSTPK
jgi:flagellar biosynthesis protein